MGKGLAIEELKEIFGIEQELDIPMKDRFHNKLTDEQISESTCTKGSYEAEQEKLNTPIVSGSYVFNKELIEKAMTADKPYYAIGVDTYDKENLAYCLTRKIGDTTETLLSKVSREETEFRQEIENLAKYFEADVFENGD